MEWIMAIAALCQVGTSHYYITSVDKYQLKCQQYYIECLEKKTGSESVAAAGWQGPLKECVKERKVK